MKDVERFTDEVNKDFQDKGIDYLVLSAGGPPTGKWRMSPEVPNRRKWELMIGNGESFCGTMFIAVLSSRKTTDEGFILRIDCYRILRRVLLLLGHLVVVRFTMNRILVLRNLKIKVK